MILLSDTRGGSLESRRQTIVGLLTTAIFNAFVGDVFRTFRDKTNVIIQRHGVYCRLSTGPKIRDLE